MFNFSMQYLHAFNNLNAIKIDHGSKQYANI